MRTHPRFLLFFIVLLTAFAVILDLPKTNPISFKTPKLPGLNKQISFTLPIAGSTIGNVQFPFKRGLDLAGGTSVTLRADVSKVAPDKKKDALESAKIVLENRVNLFGVSEPTIQTAQVGNDYRLIVDLPGINVDQAVSLIGTTAQLTFWESATTSAIQFIPNAPIQYYGNYIKPTDLTGKDLKNSTVVFDPQTGNPQVQIVFTPDGGKKFGILTQKNLGKPLVIVLDNQIVSAPTVQAAILDGTAVITGQFTTDQAKTLSIELQAGALPIPLSILAQQSIGATLGQSSLQKSLFAGMLGLLIIVLFMIVLYGRLGVMASAALLVYTLLVLAVFKLIPVTLTLAGIAGFILSIGMAVDANILIFERTKEEIRDGRAVKPAIELGFSRAWTSIRDSNISTLITSAILFYFGTGIVKGFALTLAIGVVISMFSAIVVTRTLLRTFYRY
jgi:preprotein translocase subunit SecD